MRYVTKFQCTSIALLTGSVYDMYVKLCQTVHHILQVTFLLNFKKYILLVYRANILKIYINCIHLKSHVYV